MNKTARIEARTKISGLRVERVLLFAVAIAILGLAQFAFALPLAMSAWPGSLFNCPDELIGVGCKPLTGTQ